MSSAAAEPSSLVVGATGATGKWLCEHLLQDGVKVTAVVRSKDRLPEQVRNHHNLTVVEHEDPLKMSNDEWKKHLAGVDSVASCLGHNLSFKGWFFPPRLLCHDTAKKVISNMEELNQQNGTRTKFILMNTVGTFNHDLTENGFTWPHWAITGVLRWTIPAVNDNECAANFLRTDVGKAGSKFPTVDWAVVRPDSLVDKDTVSEIAVHASPTRNWMTNPTHTARINCAWFMKELMVNQTLFNQWNYQMPAVYNKEGS